MNASKKLNGGLLPPIVEIHPKMPNLPLAQCSFWLRLGSMSACTRDACTPESCAFLLEVTDSGIEQGICLFSLENNGMKDYCRPSHPCNFSHLQAFCLKLFHCHRSKEENVPCSMIELEMVLHLFECGTVGSLQCHWTKFLNLPFKFSLKE